eukprot:scaffold7215_cov366-Prasinococcus_capsulatus_cf.AAC.5
MLHQMPAHAGVAEAISAYQAADTDGQLTGSVVTLTAVLLGYLFVAPVSPPGTLLWALLTTILVTDATELCGVQPVIMFYLHKRWFKKFNSWEVFFRFFLVFAFFPALLLWNPFVNFRADPRDNERMI